MKASQVNALSLASLSAFSSAAFTRIVGELSASTIASLSTQTFDTLLGSKLSLISTSAIAGISAADLSSLTTAQQATFTQAQLTAMSSGQLLSLNAVIVDAISHEVNGALSYSAMLAVLQDADAGAMTAQKMAGLQQLVSEINASGGIQTSAYVQQITDDVVLGNSANAYWTGGASTSTALGNLTASSTQSQFSELIGKWFLGTDRPSTSLAAFNENYPIAYQAFTQPLFASNGPSPADINQGADGDCYFLAAIGEIALQDPTTIENMISQNANGTYSVEFQINGQPDFITVDNELPVLQNGYRMANGSTIAFENGGGTLWAPLVEKAFAQLCEQTSAATGQLGVHGNSYADIAGGYWQGLTEVTGQSVQSFNTYQGESASLLQPVLQSLQAALSAREDVIMATPSQSPPSGSNLQTDHMFMVLGVNAAAGTVTLENPWGTNVAGSGLQATFTDSIATLASDSVSFGVTMGKSVLG